VILHYSQTTEYASVYSFYRRVKVYRFQKLLVTSEDFSN